MAWLGLGLVIDRLDFRPFYYNHVTTLYTLYMATRASASKQWRHVMLPAEVQQSTATEKITRGLMESRPNGNRLY